MIYGNFIILLSNVLGNISHTICHVESASASLPIYLETLLAGQTRFCSFCERIERYCFVGLHLRRYLLSDIR
jgi:hypothetical protein